MVTTVADAGDDVSVTRFGGIIEIDSGSVTVIQVFAARSGGSDTVVTAELADRCADADVVVTTPDSVGRVTDALRDGDLPYEVSDAPTSGRDGEESTRSTQ